ncbi:MAG: hypothetical protein EA394_11405 [Bacteroidia bacterium]|nr:MAG: hypothetical protein EA394_11405 [Bacteroidia bacterium]
MEAIILAVILLALAIGGIAIKMFIKPGETFTKSCTSTYDPDSGKQKPCSCASGIPEECDSNTELKENNIA